MRRRSNGECRRADNCTNVGWPKCRRVDNCAKCRPQKCQRADNLYFCIEHSVEVRQILVSRETDCAFVSSSRQKEDKILVPRETEIIRTGTVIRTRTSFERGVSFERASRSN